MTNNDIQFFDDLILKTVTIDELLSDKFETLTGTKKDVDLATKRLAEWCKSAASGNWKLFDKRLKRDGLTFEKVLARFANPNRILTGEKPIWIQDAIWIDLFIRKENPHLSIQYINDHSSKQAFEEILLPVIKEAENILWSNLNRLNFSDTACACMRQDLHYSLTDLCAPIFFEKFKIYLEDKYAKMPPKEFDGSIKNRKYNEFIKFFRDTGFRTLISEKPVLIRLISGIVRQWINSKKVFISRFNDDLILIENNFSLLGNLGRAAKIESGLSDLHNFGNTVSSITFENNTKVIYKPKDVNLDCKWEELVKNLNDKNPPIDLKAAKVLACEGYGWMEYIEHSECSSASSFNNFFRRAGALLALFHVFAATDMHEENIIAAGEYPIPIDLEMLLQPKADVNMSPKNDKAALELATEKIENSVLMIGMLPAFAKSIDNKIYGMGGLQREIKSIIKKEWDYINTDNMRPSKPIRITLKSNNTPYFSNNYAQLGDYINELVDGFESFASFLVNQKRLFGEDVIHKYFQKTPVRKVIRPTRFYDMLIQRLKEKSNMSDGIIWSAQIDFVSRFNDWEFELDPMGALQYAERCALADLNVPFFMSSANGLIISDYTGPLVKLSTNSGICRAQDRFNKFSEKEILWQIEIIRQSTITTLRPLNSNTKNESNENSGVAVNNYKNNNESISLRNLLLGESKALYELLSTESIITNDSAAWVGLNWVNDSQICQLAPLGYDLYGGSTGVAIFLCAYAKITHSKEAASLGLAGIHSLRKSIHSLNSDRMARNLGIGGATGLGSIIYSLTILSKINNDESLLSDAHSASQLITDAIIESDILLDVINGSAGAILALLCLYRATGSIDVLDRAIMCGDHLLKQQRIKSGLGSSWRCSGANFLALNGMSHGAAGFAYALYALASVTGRGDYLTAASECISFENASFDQSYSNWPDIRHEEKSWPNQWCHGSTGIGLSRIGILNLDIDVADMISLKRDVEKAVKGTSMAPRNSIDTLCCGTFGSIEFLYTAQKFLSSDALGDLASNYLNAIIEDSKNNGGYRFRGGLAKFNLGFFQGLSGIGYTMLRRLDASLPNVIIWE